MSIQSEIDRLIAFRDRSFEAVREKGVTVPEDATIDDLPGYIAQIEGARDGALVLRTASGNPIVITDGGDGTKLQALVVTVAPKQSGSGTPSPSNVRDLTGYDSVVVSRSEDGRSWTSSLGDAGTVYAGSLDMTTGLLTVTGKLFAFAVANMNNSENYPGWTNSGIKSAIGSGKNGQLTLLACNAKTAPYGVFANTNGSNDIVYLARSTWGVTGQSQFKADYPDLVLQFLVSLPSPLTYQLTPQQLSTLQGANTFTCNAGNMAMEYLASAKLAG